MKRFIFSMQKVLDYDGHVQKCEENILREMRNNYNNLCAEKEELSKIYEYYVTIYATKCETGIQVNEIGIYKSYITQIHTQIELLNNRIEIVEDEIDKQIKKVLLVTRDKTSLEKLKGKSYEKYQTEEKKQEELFINEFIVNTESYRTESREFSN